MTSLALTQDDVNMLGENPQTIRENTGILPEASKAIGLEVNPENTKYMIMSRDENIVRNGNIKIGDLSFEGVEKFKYLGTTVTNINGTREEIKCRINMGIVCYSAEKLLSSSLLSKNLKVRIYKTVILPVVLYGCETRTFTLREEQRLRVFENKRLNGTQIIDRSSELAARSSFVYTLELSAGNCSKQLRLCCTGVLQSELENVYGITNIVATDGGLYGLCATITSFELCFAPASRTQGICYHRLRMATFHNTNQIKCSVSMLTVEVNVNKYVSNRLNPLPISQQYVFPNSSHSCHYWRYRTYWYVLFRMNAVLARQLLGYTPLRKCRKIEFSRLIG
ncbi:hypothetical protein ANN_16035 [Periplaneta americana]|uniref:Uncharacterized protein n=1 Tax=Periplaneta americana TaxID=6978 RepID=A0ABQ8SHW6_PERAM|nr:hypothetical protein ANN_16035 [Periplaneta americana]